MRIELDGVYHHLISYYKEEDCLKGTFYTPQRDPDLKHLVPREKLIKCRTFRELDFQDNTDTTPRSANGNGLALSEIEPNCALATQAIQCLDRAPVPSPRQGHNVGLVIAHSHGPEPVYSNPSVISNISS